MAFRPHCPKCGSHNIVLDKDRAGGWGNPQVMLHCSCGKVIYGEENIEALHASQLKAWQADKVGREADRKAEKERVQAHQQRGQVEQMHREQQQQRRREAEAEREQKRLTNLAWAESVARKPPQPETQSTVEQGTCTWTLCENSLARNSKYCSVACKNKNARWRHKQRKQAGK